MFPLKYGDFSRPVAGINSEKYNLFYRAAVLSSYNTMISTLRDLIRRTNPCGRETQTASAYDDWSESYDHQPGNLVLDMEESIFSRLLEALDLRGAVVIDFGCGTGRHWPKIYEKNPGFLMGFDLSDGMLARLKEKFPRATVVRTKNLLPPEIASGCAGCLISTLTLAHIPRYAETIASWARVMKPGADLILTDFHPDMLKKGATRSFTHQQRTRTITSHIRAIGTLCRIFKDHGFELLRKEERIVDENAKPYYEAKDALNLYEKFRGYPLVFGLHLKKI